MLDINPLELAQKINNLADEIATGKSYKARFLNKVKWLKNDLALKKISKKEYEEELAKYLRGKPESYWTDYYNNYLAELINQLEYANNKIIEFYTGERAMPPKIGIIPTPPRKIVVPPKPGPKAEYVLMPGAMRLDVNTKKRYLKELNLDEEYLKLVVKRRKDKKAAVVEKEYTLYESNPYGKVANRFFEGMTLKLTKDYPEIFVKLYQDRNSAGIKVLSKTYISMGLMSAVIAFLAVTILASAFFTNESLAVQIARGFMLGIFSSIGTLGFFYFYPSSVVSEREKEIKTDLPFVIVHMSAVAGSGAKPISMFSTILTSGQYPGIRDEVKKIVNYVNIFGYDISTALKVVAKSTPSVKFKDLLEGIVTTIESGGSMKEYLVAVAEDTMTTYKLELQKWTEAVATYSDIYTSLLIAAPLLFMVTLRIIASMGMDAGMVRIASLGGILLGIPLLNGGFILFVTLMQPK